VQNMFRQYINKYYGSIFINQIIVNNQHDSQFFFHIYLFQFSTCFEHPCAHHQENQLHQYDIWYMSLYVGDRQVCMFGWNWCSIRTCTLDGHLHSWHITDVILIQLILLMMSTGVLETCRELEEIYKKKNWTSSWLFTRIQPRCTVNKT